MSLPAAVPAIAEPLNFLDYYFNRSGDSQFVPGAKTRVARFICPGCQTERDPLPPDTVVACEKCGLRCYHACGDLDLYVWREPVAKVA